MTASPITAQVSFTKLIVGDLDRATAFYTAIADLREVARIEAEQAGRPVEEVITAPTGGGTGLMLVRYTDAATSPTGEVVLGMRTSDVDGLLERIVANGGRVVQPKGVIETMGTAITLAFATDPEGHLLEIIENGP